MASNPVLTRIASGAKASEIRYCEASLRDKPWGETRYSSGTTATNYRYTGQREESSFGLYFYNARWLDVQLGRFVQADSIVPGGVQGLDRYEYANNSPLVYVDPTGRFTEGAIYSYLYGQCLGTGSEDDDKQAMRAAKCASSTMSSWKADKDWWDMISAAQAGDVLFGSVVNNVNNNTQPFTAPFVGSGTTSLTGINYNGTGGAGITLTDIQEGHTHISYRQTKVTWIGFFRPAGNTVPTIWHIRPGYEVPNGGLHREDVDPYSQWVVDWTIGSMAGSLCGVAAIESAGLAFGACSAAGALITDQVLDGLDMNPGDVHFIVGPLYFNYEVIIGGGAVSYSLEHIKYSSGYCKFSQCP